jgi:hypothetical protein
VGDITGLMFWKDLFSCDVSHELRKNGSLSEARVRGLRRPQHSLSEDNEDLSISGAVSVSFHLCDKYLR